MRGWAAQAQAEGHDWRDVMANLRGCTPRLWQHLSKRDRRQFLRHLQPWWDTHRHRLAPGIHCAAAMAALPGMADDFKTTLKTLRKDYAVDDVVTIFHSCQRNLCVHDGFEGLHIVNFIKLLADSMGIDVDDDIYRNWKVAGDEAAVREVVGDDSIGKVGAQTFERLVLPELARNKSH